MRSAAVPPGQRGRLQQGVALLEHPVVVGAHPCHPRRTRGDQFVEEPPALARVALDQRQILRREEHRAHDAQHVTRPDLRRSVDAGAVRLAGVELEFDQLAALALADRGPDDGALGAHADQRGVRGDPVAAECGQIADSFDEVGLALAVGSHEGGDARLKCDLDPGVRAEVGERQMRDVHGGRRPPPGLTELRVLWMQRRVPGAAPVGTRGCTVSVTHSRGMVRDGMRRARRPARERAGAWCAAVSSSRPRGRRTGCAAPRSSSSGASPPGGRRSARRARR